MQYEESEWKSVDEILSEGESLANPKNIADSVNILYKRVKERRVREMMGGCKKEREDE